MTQRQNSILGGKGRCGRKWWYEADHLWRQCAGEMLLYVLPRQIHIQLKTAQACSVWGVTTSSINAPSSVGKRRHQEAPGPDYGHTPSPRQIQEHVSSYSDS